MNDKKITEDMSMGKVIEEFPSSQRALFQGFHIGGCNSCGYSMDESIKQVCEKHNKSVDEVIDYIYKSDEIEKKMHIDVDAAKVWIAEEPVKIIDIRDIHETEGGMIENSILLDRPLMNEIMTSWPKETKILSYCQLGHRSADFASYMIGHGFSNVKTLDGGIEAWNSLLVS